MTFSNLLDFLYFIIGNLIRSQKKYSFGVKMVKISLQMKKLHALRGEKGEKSPQSPITGFGLQNSVWSCDISIDLKFYMNQN
jgi:hypothetical protein